MMLEVLLEWKSLKWFICFISHNISWTPIAQSFFRGKKKILITLFSGRGIFFLCRHHSVYIKKHTHIHHHITFVLLLGLMITLFLWFVIHFSVVSRTASLLNLLPASRFQAFSMYWIISTSIQQGWDRGWARNKCHTEIRYFEDGFIKSAPRLPQYRES